MRNSTGLVGAFTLSVGTLGLLCGGAVSAQEAPAPSIRPAVLPEMAAQPSPSTQAAPQPAAAQPQVAFSARLVEAASAFETYTRTAAAIRADFTSGAAVRSALQTGSTYEVDQMGAGQVAFAAIIALQDPDFVDGVRRLQTAPEAAAMLLAQPSSVSRIAGSEGAASLVSAALRARGDLVLKSGRAVKQAAYDIQHQSWSLSAVPDAAGVLQQSKSLSLVRFKAGAADTGLLIKTAQEAAAGERTSGGGAMRSPVVQRALALAALAVMGRAGDGEEERLQPLLTEAESAQCLKMSKLNLYQCLSVAGPHYEDVFCLGQHALIDTAQCVMDSAGSPPAAVPITVAGSGAWGGGSQVASLIPVAATRIAAQSK